jgi:hypothetical protein
MRHGFTIKPGETDLKDYVYAAARELIERSNAGEAAMQAAAGDLPEGYLMEIGIERGAGWVDLTDENGEKIDFDEDTDSGMTQRIRNSTAAAIEHAKEHA